MIHNVGVHIQANQLFQNEKKTNNRNSFLVFFKTTINTALHCFFFKWPVFLFSILGL